jgi:hypothetical protein
MTLQFVEYLIILVQFEGIFNLEFAQRRDCLYKVTRLTVMLAETVPWYQGRHS